MNVWEARIVVRERGLAEIVDLAVRFALVLGRGLYARLAACLLLPAYALCWLLDHAGVDPILLWLTVLTLFSLLQLPFTVAAGRLLFNADVTVGEVLRASARLLFRACMSRSLALLLLIGGVMTVVGAPFAIARALYMGEVIVLEGAGVVGAYRRTSRLTSRRVATEVGVWFSIIAASSTFVVAVEIIARSLAAEGLPIGALDEVWGGLSPAAAIAGLFLSIPLVATLRFLAYIDIRTRREGWDIQVRFLELGRVLSAGEA